MATRQKALRRVLVLFLSAVLPGCHEPYTPKARQPKLTPYDTVASPMQCAARACEFYAARLGQYPFSPEGSDEALRLAIRTSFGPVDAAPETVDAWLRFREASAPGEVDLLYLNDADAGRLPEGTIMLVEKCPIHADGKLYVVPRLGWGTRGGRLYLIDSGGLSPAEVLGRRLSEFPVSMKRWPEADPHDISVHMECLRVQCESHADLHDGQYAFSPEGSDEALRLVIRGMFEGGEAPPVLVDMWLRYRSTSAPGEVDYLYLNDPDARRLPLGTIMLVEKVPIHPDGKLYVAPRVGWKPTGSHVHLIDSGGLSPAEVLGRRLSDFATSPAFP